MNIIFDEADWTTSFQSLCRGGDLNFVERLKELPRDTLRKTFIARSGCELVGIASCQPWGGAFPSVVKEDTFFVGIVSLAYVIPAFRGKMIGRTLVQNCTNYLQEIGCKQVIVSAISQDSLSFFGNCGFNVANVLSVSLDSIPPPVSIDMGPENGITIVEKGPECDNIVTAHWKAMWLEAGIPTDAFKDDFDTITQSFITQARQSDAYQTFAAIHTTSEQSIICGSISCQIVNQTSPQMLLRHDLVGTVWAVYVHPSYRRRGIARELMRRVMEYWKGRGCSSGVLMYASEGGRRIYERLGFAPNYALSLMVQGSPNTPPPPCSLPTPSSPHGIHCATSNSFLPGTPTTAVMLPETHVFIHVPPPPPLCVTASR